MIKIINQGFYQFLIKSLLHRLLKAVKMLSLKTTPLSKLKPNQKFVICRNGAPSINVHTLKSFLSDGMVSAETSKNTPRILPSYALVFPFNS